MMHDPTGERKAVCTHTRGSFKRERNTEKEEEEDLHNEINFRLYFTLLFSSVFLLIFLLFSVVHRMHNCITLQFSFHVDAID